MDGAIQVSVTVKSRRGRVEVRGPGRRFRGRISTPDKRIARGQEIPVQLTLPADRVTDRGPDADRIALLGLVVEAGDGAGSIEITRGAVFTLEVLLLARAGVAIPVGSVFATSEPLPRPRRGRSKERDEVTGLVGNLAAMSLIDVVQSLEVCNRTARVEVQPADGTEGRIYLEHGRVVHAFWNHLTGPDAFQHLAALDEGLFRVRFERKPEARSIEGPNAFLVMDALRRLDEDNRFKAEGTRTDVAAPPRIERTARPSPRAHRT